jgi:23S rRNA pseudouridine1911/1915/1917 synthase
MDLRTIYEDDNLLVVDKPAGVVVFPEGPSYAKAADGQANTVIDVLIERYPELKAVGEAPRYGVVHRLDKDTSGLLLVAKTAEALIFFQKQFKNRRVEKKYVCLVEGRVKEDSGTIDALLARSTQNPKKQTVYLKNGLPPRGAREAITEYKVVKRFEDYTLLEVQIKTGRRHQIRAHFAWLQHPVAGDKVYGFKNSKTPEALLRQFLHAEYVKIEMPNGEVTEFRSDLPEDLQTALDQLK